MKYTRYNLATGKIRSNVMTDNIQAQLRDGEGYIDGWYAPDQYEIRDGVPVEITLEPVYVVDHLRINRDSKLRDSDWTQLADNALTDAQRAAWRTYRQALRDLPASYPDNVAESDIAWPNEP